MLCSLFPDGEPVLLQVATELADGHPVDPGATLVAHTRLIVSPYAWPSPARDPRSASGAGSQAAFQG
jgi:hypothetical protein